MPCIAKQPDDIDEDERLLTERQSAQWLGYGWSTWVKERDQIPYIKVGKFKRRTKRILRRYQASRFVKPPQIGEVRP